ncbi:GNAT family N-acetyltransferase [Streptomyces sp. URMC 123]|uniref:GNAT family N-acetyltransferase n=1 Tax=Streptomyces sp. URMC 123 TaxID=3423403 RepID=UPI003F1E2C03
MCHVIVLEAGVDKDRRALIEERLEAVNQERSAAMRALRGTPAEHDTPVHVFARCEGSDELAGGLTGYTWGRWLHVDLLWVDERWRGRGLGERLMARAEEIARTEHGCGHSRVETWDFQAPDFYRRLGYEVVGEVRDYPPGVTEYLLAKRLAPPS